MCKDVKSLPEVLPAWERKCSFFSSLSTVVKLMLRVFFQSLYR